MMMIRTSLRRRFYTCHSMSSCLPDWREALEECADTIENYGGKPDFAIALVGEYSEMGAATLEEVSSQLARRGWPATVGVRTKSIQRTPGIQICAGVTNSSESPTLLPALSLDERDEVWTSPHRGIQELYLLFSTDIPGSDMISHLQRSISDESHFCLGVSSKSISAENATVFVGPQAFQDGVGGISIPICPEVEGAEDFVADIIYSVYGNSDWDRRQNAAESMNGFVCDSKLTQSLFGLDMNFNNEDHEDDDDVGNDDEEELAKHMKNFDKDMKEEMEKWKDPNYRNLEFEKFLEEIGELEEHEEEEEDQEEEDEFEDEDFDVGTEIPHFGGVPLIDDAVGVVFPNQKSLVTVNKTSSMMTVKNALSTKDKRVAIIPSMSEDGVGTLVRLQEVRNTKSDGQSTILLQGLERFRCFRTWCVPHGFGAMHGEIEVLQDKEYDESEIRKFANTLLYDAQRAGIVSLSETEWNHNDIVWTVADRLCALSPTSSSQYGVRWIEMTDPIERMKDVSDALNRYVAENNEDDIV